LTMTFFFNSLRFRLIILVLIAAIPAIALTIYTGLEQRAIARASGQEAALRIARLASSHQAAQIEGGRQLLIALAHLPQVQSLDTDLCNPLFQELGPLYPQYVTLRVVNSEGRVICSTLPDHVGFSLAFRPYFHTTIQRGSFTVSDFIVGSLTERSMLPLTYPFFDQNDQFKGMIVATMSLEWLMDLAQTIDLPEQSAILMVNSEGTILARHPDPDTFVGRTVPEAEIIQEILQTSFEGYAETEGVDGVERLFAFNSLSGMLHQGAFISVGIPTSIAYAEANYILIRNLGLLSLVTLFALATAWVSSERFLLKSIKGLVGVTRRLASGDMSTRAAVSTGPEEISYLARSFNYMANTIEQRDAQIRQAEAKYRSLIEQIPAITYAVEIGSNPAIIFVSPQLETFFGYKPSEWTDAPELWFDFIHPEDRQEVQEKIEAARRSGTAYEVEYRLKSKGGWFLWVQDSALPVRDTSGSPLFLQGILSDLTSRKNTEEKLKEYNIQLERSNRELQDFAYIASHDLQEPLRKIQAFGERLETKYGENLGDIGIDYLKRMQQSAARMQNLINDLLSYSRVTSKANPFVKTNLNRVLTDVLGDLGERFKMTGGRAEVQELPEIEADPVQMRQLLQNLVSNALKFQRKGIPPVVKIYCVEKEQGNGRKSPYLELFVEDQGIGFDEKYLDRIFQPFQRLHGRLEYEGSGMGLAICRKIVERHNGSITAKSAPDEGTTFIITLPIYQPIKGKEFAA
jgi:PAS domain S-box-containing protein